MARRPGLAALLVGMLSVAGCVSVPTGGPVQSYPVTQGTAAQNQPYVQFQPQPPGAGWDPAQIVQGFLTASASSGTYQQVAKQYLTAQEQRAWSSPTLQAVVYKSGPNVTAPVYHPAPGPKATTATVYITGALRAVLNGNDNYFVPPARETFYQHLSFELEKGGDGQWRISSAPNQLLLTSNAFQNDYQLSNLYFFDPAARYLVPDPVYVPLVDKPADLMNVLVDDMITPPPDWLSGATKTAFPRGTKIGSVTVDGVTAVVNLTGSAIGKAGTLTMEQVSAQLLSTLSTTAQTEGSGEPVQSVQVEVNGKPWAPPGGDGSPVQRLIDSKWQPATGRSPDFYYVDAAGYLVSRPSAGGAPVRLEKVGTGYSKIAVSPDGNHLAALRGGTLYTGPVGGTMSKQNGTYLAISWDANDNLWASTGPQIVMFRGSANARQPLGQLIPVSLNSVGAPYTGIAVAPDGVRVAIVEGGDTLTFGAISGQQGSNPQISPSQVYQTPVTTTNNAQFTALAWYGPNDVITLADPGPALTEYSVSGGTSNPIPALSGMLTITASSGQPLIAGLSHGLMVSDASPTGNWTSLSGVGGSPAYPG